MRIIPLQEGNYFVDKNRAFIPLTSAINEQGLKLAVQPFLVITDTDYMLIETGSGYEYSGRPIIKDLLAKEGITPEQITKVFLSHFHKDHIDGLGIIEEGKYQLNFPNAQVFGQKREYEYALSQTQSTSYNFQKLMPLQDLSNMVWMNEDSGNLIPEISYQVVGGHSPYLQVFWIKNDTETYFFGSDNLPQESYWQHSIAYKSDYDGKKARDLRTHWKQQAQEENWKILLYHDMEKTII